MKLPNEINYDIEKDDNRVNNNINNELNNIYEMISTLDSNERKKYYAKLSELIKNYRNECKSIPTKGLTLITQESIDISFLVKLSEFKLEIESYKKEKFDVESKLELNEIDIKMEELQNRKDKLFAMKEVPKTLTK